jgi:nucleotide-binding universal stress UspA family protein
MSPNEIARIEAQWVQNGRDALEAVTRAASDCDVKSKVVVVKSDLVAESIIAAAKKHKCDLVVMASHGRKGLKRLLLGSETQHVLTHSHIPVLVLR